MPALASPATLLIGVDFGNAWFDPQLQELGLLAETAGLQPVARLTCKRRAPDAALFVGRGKTEEIRELAEAHGAAEVLFDQALSPVQQRNLERAIGLPVNDRTLLILQIFAQRARSAEGKLQVELARLQYLSTRLVRRWTHLERQQGGIGTRGGPGEAQIELDRRMIATAIGRAKRRLAKLKKQRATQRRQRLRQGTFNISLVGYTNAGKSTLFNALVKGEAWTADQLFATLDTTTRKLYLEAAETSVALSDTVGFIHDLPHGLVEAFAATLQEASDADLLIHVVDAASPDFRQQMADVQRVLQEIGAADVPRLLVFNKLDTLAPEQVPLRMRDVVEENGQPVVRLFLSATTGRGLDALRDELAQRVTAATSAGSHGADPAFGHNTGYSAESGWND
ncbi:MAG: GTPase HflX [Ottowia sp.]|nr:GTPase HflX [Ottowia sp.]